MCWREATSRPRRRCIIYIAEVVFTVLNRSSVDSICNRPNLRRHLNCIQLTEKHDVTWKLTSLSDRSVVQELLIVLTQKRRIVEWFIPKSSKVENPAKLPIKRSFQAIADRWNRLGIILAQTSHVSPCQGKNQLLQALLKPPDSTPPLQVVQALFKLNLRSW